MLELLRRTQGFVLHLDWTWNVDLYVDVDAFCLRQDDEDPLPDNVILVTPNIIYNRKKAMKRGMKMKGMICIVFLSIQTIAANIFAPIKFSATNTSATCYMRKHPIPGYSPDPGLAFIKRNFSRLRADMDVWTQR